MVPGVSSIGARARLTNAVKIALLNTIRPRSSASACAMRSVMLLFAAIEELASLILSLNANAMLDIQDRLV